MTRSSPLKHSFRLPQRTSSKDRAVSKAELETERQVADDDIRKSRKNLKGRSSFDSGYWTDRTYIAERYLDYVNVERKISVKNFSENIGLPVEAWNGTEEAATLYDREKGYILDRKLFLKQVYQLRCDPAQSYNKPTRRMFIELHGQAFMSRIFGPEADQELFSVNNSILMLEDVKKFFDKGFLVIVPCIEDDKSVAQINEWQASNPKRYKVRIVERTATEMKTIIPGKENEMWIDLDGRELIFRSNHRPRARYLYFYSCVAMLRRSWHHEERETLLRDELGKKFWAIPGLVEEIGNEGLLDGAVEDDGGDLELEPDLMGIAVANDRLRLAGPEGRDVSTDLLEDSDDENDIYDEEDSDDEEYSDEE